jgi:hypothetical protein
MPAVMVSIMFGVALVCLCCSLWAGSRDYREALGPCGLGPERFWVEGVTACTVCC